MGVLLFVVAFLACVTGAVCGIGGGVIIKPVLDLLSVASVPTISFLSSCTVFCMSLYSVGRSLAAREKAVDLKRGTPLAIGAALGGVAGSLLFDWVRSTAPEPNQVGAIQAACLVAVTLFSLLYTLFRRRIKARNVTSAAACLVIGGALGLMSSFLGIGGGPINLVVLYHFFSMDTKTAAKNSLYIILFSQAANLLSLWAAGAIPAFVPLQLLLMAAGGILGGMMGRQLHHRVREAAVEKLFLFLMGCIILISCYNTVKFL